ncbi:hypothetical protein ACLOJK_001234 [Asimina triloba]
MENPKSTSPKVHLTPFILFFVFVYSESTCLNLGRHRARIERKWLGMGWNSKGVMGGSALASTDLFESRISHLAMKLSSAQCSPPAGGYGRTARSGQAQPFRLQTEVLTADHAVSSSYKPVELSRGQMKDRAFARKLQEMDAEEARHRIRVAQGLPLTTDKPETIYKPPVKEQTKPMEFKLHTQQRAAQRAGFNDLVSSTPSSDLLLYRRQIERLRKVG